MIRYAKIIHFVLLYLQLVSIDVSSARIRYKEILAKGHVEQKLKLLGPRALLKNYKQSRVSKACFQTLDVYLQGVQRRNLWALQMMDSSSKVPSGLLWGNVIDIGTYDECVEVNEKNLDVIGEIRGQHCTYSIGPMMVSPERKFPFNPILSVCMPAKCTNNDLVELINSTIDANSVLKSSGLSVSYAACTKNIDLHIDTELVVFVVVMGLYIGFLSLCTIFDICNRTSVPRKRNSMINYLIKFSYLKSAKAILNMNVEKGELPALHGLRVLNTFWLIVVHEYFFHIISPLANFLELSKWFISWNFLIPMVGLYCVDTFFVMSGFLTAFAFFKQRQQNKKFNIFYYYLHRLLRLAPVAIVVLYITLVLIPKIPTINSGPRMDWLLDIFISRCRSKWPSVLFFIQNLVEKDNYCLQNLWSVSAEVQLMWLSPLILLVLHKAPKIGLSILVILLTASITSYAVILGMNKHPAIYFVQDQSITTTVRAYEDIYELTYTRASPWLLGIFLGYIVQEKSLKLSRLMNGLGWLITVAAFTFCVIGIKTFTNEEYEYDIYWEMTFAAFSKPLWGFIICWIIYDSIIHPNNILARALSSKIFVPFSRISYSLCIVHIVFPLLQFGFLKTPRYFSDYTVLQSGISNIVISSISAFAFSMTFEMPTRTLEKIILNRKKDVFDEKDKKN